MDRLTSDLPELSKYPPFSQWNIANIDACANLSVPQDKIPTILKALGLAFRSRTDLFTVNDETVALRNSGFYFKAYDKLAEVMKHKLVKTAECDPITPAANVLRIEGSATNVKSIRRILTAQNVTLLGHYLSLREAATTEIADAIMSYYLKKLDLHKPLIYTVDAFPFLLRNFSKPTARSCHRFISRIRENGAQGTRREYGPQSYNRYLRKLRSVGISPYTIDDQTEALDLSQAISRSQNESNALVLLNGHSILQAPSETNHEDASPE